MSPMITVPMSGCLSFYYQRNQSRGNLFSVFTRDLLGHYEEIWRPDVYATTTWKLVQVDIKVHHPSEVSARNVRSSKCMALLMQLYCVSYCTWFLFLVPALQLLSLDIFTKMQLFEFQQRGRGQLVGSAPMFSMQLKNPLKASECSKNKFNLVSLQLLIRVVLRLD